MARVETDWQMEVREVDACCLIRSRELERLPDGEVVSWQISGVNIQMTNVKTQ